MTPIYDANTLRKVSSDTRLADFNYVKDNYVPKALCKINETNFAAANSGRNSSSETFKLLDMGLTTEEMQNYFRIGLKTKLEALGLIVNIFTNTNSIITVFCKW